MDISSSTYYGDVEINQDSIGTLEDGGCACFVVADGSLSTSGGNIASDTIVKSVLNDFKNTNSVTRETLTDYYKKADDKLWAKTEESGGTASYMASAAVLLTDGKCAINAHLGNCRMYYLSENFLQFITPDHTLAYDDHAAGKFRFPGIRKSPNRRKVRAYLGSDPMCTPEISEPFAIKEGDAFLLCTDGFWEQITERQVERTLKHSKTAAEWLKKMLRIVRNSRPKHDNYSAVTVRF